MASLAAAARAEAALEWGVAEEVAARDPIFAKYRRRTADIERRDNLVTEVHVHCYGDCGPDLDANVDAAARAWADAIDKEARSAGG